MKNSILKSNTVNNKILIILFLFTSIAAKAQMGSNKEITLIKEADFEKIVDGKKVRLYTLKNKMGTVCQITNYGGKVVSLWIPDKNGDYEDVVLGHSNIDDFLTTKERYFGALIGRYGNRIGQGKFTLDGKEYTLVTNNGNNHLHGGNKGYDAVVWDVEQINPQALELSYLSKHMEEGYPGNLTIKVKYQLTDHNELKIEYWASTDQSTIVNLTHHSFFNLKGAGNGTINDHLLQINASRYTPVDEGLIPTGELLEVENTPMDFQESTPIGKRVNESYEQLRFGLGYDHNFVLNQNKNGLNFAAKVVEPTSGRVMEVFTNEPGLQFYGGNFLDGSVTGKYEKSYGYRTAFCLETQHFPDSPNKPQFPSVRLDPDQEYYSICIYKFSTVE
ncbi:aldose epimerase family protein [Flagellimonas sp.]|uniref:aldose epimerase family protein n=1 Tax=Flagellimonas sp. TaxID=2058762 RepID=UPI003B5931CB